MEQTDESIREALRNLPPDLSTTYDRILRRSEYRHGHSYQRQILSFLLAALRPLEMNELSGALAVVPGDIDWKSDNQVNNVYHALTCCESLVIVAEEERTVQFVHQSVVQFLLDQKSSSATLHFDLAQASLELGEVCVTYLNYGMFDQRLSTNVVPPIPAGLIPAKIAQDTLKESSLIGQLALMFLNFQSTDGPDISRVLAETSPLHRKRQEAASFGFLKYASQHWLIHTMRIDPTRRTFSLWRGLLQHSKFDGLVCGPNEIHPNKLHFDRQFGNKMAFPPRVTWAITHSHLPLLSFELRSGRGLKAVCSIVPYIRIMLREGGRLEVDRAMAIKLFQVAVVAEADDIANLLLRAHQTPGTREAFLEPFVKQSEHAKVEWVMSLENFGKISEMNLRIVELACHARNLHFLSLALDLRAKVDLYDQNPLVFLVKEMRDPVDLALACRLLKAGFSLKDCDGMPEQLYWFLRYYSLVNDPNNFDPHLILIGRVSTATCESIIRRACSNGNLEMVQKLFSNIHWLSFRNLTIYRPENYLLWMGDALRTYSTDRWGIVRLLGQLLERYLEQIQPRKRTDQWHSMWLGIFRRCLQLRAWVLAETVRNIPYLQATSFRKVLMSFTASDGNRKKGRHGKHPNAGDETQLWSGTASEHHKEPKINADDSAESTLDADEYERTVFETSKHVSLLHLSASCGDAVGVEFLLDVLASDAHRILSASSPLDSCFGGDVPLQTVLAQEQPTIEDTANFLRIGGMILEGIGAHGTSACGLNPRSCIKLTPLFCVKVVQNITRRNREMLAPDGGSSYFWDDFQSSRCFPLLEKFLEAWVTHVAPATSPQRLLMPMLDAIVRSFGELKADIESHLHLTQDKDDIEPILKVHSKDHIDLGFILVQSLGAPGLDDMLDLLLFYDPFLQHYVTGFKNFFYQEYDSLATRIRRY